jgi:hypothetical protein
VEAPKIQRLWGFNALPPAFRYRRGSIRDDDSIRRDSNIDDGGKGRAVRIPLLLLLALALAGCARPPVLLSTVTVQPDGGAVSIKVSVRNGGHAATTPIAVELIATLPAGVSWGKPEPVIRPAPFVLNRREKRDLTARVKTDADHIRTRLILREAENGHVLKDETVETAFTK